MTLGSTWDVAAPQAPAPVDRFGGASVAPAGSAVLGPAPVAHHGAHHSSTAVGVVTRPGTVLAATMLVFELTGLISVDALPPGTAAGAAARASPRSGGTLGSGRVATLGLDGVVLGPNVVSGQMQYDLERWRFLEDGFLVGNRHHPHRPGLPKDRHGVGQCLVQHRGIGKPVGAGKDDDGEDEIGHRPGH